MTSTANGLHRERSTRGRLETGLSQAERYLPDFGERRRGYA